MLVAGYHSKFLRVYLLDDHDIVRRGLRDLLAAATDIHVVGESSSAKAATQAIPALSVDVMVLDLRLPDGTGVDVCRAVRAVAPGTQGLLLTSSDEDEALAASILAGASGYLVKLTNSSDIATAIRRIGAGRSTLDPATLERARHRLLADLERVTSVDARRLLTDVVAGLTDADIAARTGRPLAEVSAQVAVLVDRLTAPPGRRSDIGRSTSAGRHRRTD